MAEQLSMGEVDPTDQQRSWLVNKIRTDIAMMGAKLNAQVIIKNLQHMHAYGAGLADPPAVIHQKPGSHSGRASMGENPRSNSERG